MSLRRLLFSSLAALVGVAAVLSFQVAGQNSAATKVEYELQEIDRRRPDGSVERVQVQVPVVQSRRTRHSPSADGGYGGYPLAYGGYEVRLPLTQDPESQKLMAEEQAAAQEARKLSAQAQQADSDGEKADAKKKLRDKLAQIFDLQQQRRTHEIAKIEERLGKLKETLKKRDSSKDSIVDRRLEALTGGVDELGWEESFPTHVTPYGERTPMLPSTSTVPRAAEPRFTPPPSTRPAYPPGAVPTPVPPALPAPAAPPVAPAPPALSAPAR